MDWPTDHMDYLKQLTVEAAGSTTTQIARLINERFGTSYTRNAVIGKLHRSGIRGPVIARQPRVLRAASPVPVRKVPFVDRQQPAQLRSVDTHTVNPDSLDITLSELEDGMCKWMTSDATYCGIATGGRRVTYCPVHQNAGTEPARHRSVGWSEVSKRPRTRSRGVLP